VATPRTNALAAGVCLAEYRIENLLGVGGFGLTYLATDRNLNLKVALKEYLPSGIAARGEDSSIRPVDEDSAQTFEWGKQRFLDESRTLASFRHPAIVRVMRFFEANATAYMVMEFVEGQSLPHWAAARRPLGEETLAGIVAPLLDGLAVIHAAGYLHRDIKPDNLYLRADGSPVLLDFGSARQAVQNSELTSIVSPGWAPVEQYHSAGKQGPWSDLYAVGGVLYWLVTGEKPVEAVARVRQDTLAPAATAGKSLGYSPAFLEAIDWALCVNEDERPQSVAEFRERLGFAASGTDRVASRTPAPERTLKPTPTAPSGAALDAGQLKLLEAAFAQHLGPIAAVMVKKAAKAAPSIAALAHNLAQEISDDKARAVFLKKFAENSRPSPSPSQPSPAASPSAPQAGLTQLAQARFAPEILAMAEKRLSEHIGAVAKVVVKRAAAKARDEGELYLLIADEISDPAERKAFIRKAISVSGKP
jgi:serine/threonine protein kinase